MRWEEKEILKIRKSKFEA